MAKKHMCEMAENKKDFPKMEKLAENPKYICSSCDRASSKEDRLCEPETLSDSGKPKGSCCCG